LAGFISWRWSSWVELWRLKPMHQSGF